MHTNFNTICSVLQDAEIPHEVYNRPELSDGSEVPSIFVPADPRAGYTTGVNFVFNSDGSLFAVYACEPD